MGTSKQKSSKYRQARYQNVGGQARLWAPWRINYVGAAKKKAGTCLFCDAYAHSSRHQVIFKTAHSVAMLNIYPYNNGHVMVAPGRHVRDLTPLKDYEILDIFRSLDRAKSLLKRCLRPDGFNIGMNIGRAGGAGITGHLHVHLVPRWAGDTNFMPALSGTKVISQSLEELLTLLRNAHKDSR
ncbi:MAG: HIT domain-containing protein [Candidatus Omnitrophica bacterium]|nr:HIT domain-containing protein [Candidatus Omnitrophota bacterium]